MKHGSNFFTFLNTLHFPVPVRFRTSIIFSDEFKHDADDVDHKKSQIKIFFI